MRATRAVELRNRGAVFQLAHALVDQAEEIRQSIRHRAYRRYKTDQSSHRPSAANAPTPIARAGELPLCQRDELRKYLYLLFQTGAAAEEYVNSCLRS